MQRRAQEYSTSWGVGGLIKIVIIYLHHLFRKLLQIVNFSRQLPINFFFFFGGGGIRHHESPHSC